MEDFMKKKTQFLLNLALTAIFFILIIFQGPNLNPLYPVSYTHLDVYKRQLLYTEPP